MSRYVNMVGTGRFTTKEARALLALGGLSDFGGDEDDARGARAALSKLASAIETAESRAPGRRPVKQGRKPRRPNGSS